MYKKKGYEGALHENLNRQRIVLWTYVMKESAKATSTRKACDQSDGTKRHLVLYCFFSSYHNRQAQGLCFQRNIESIGRLRCFRYLVSKLLTVVLQRLKLIMSLYMNSGVSGPIRLSATTNYVLRLIITRGVVRWPLMFWRGTKILYQQGKNIQRLENVKLLR